MSLSFAVCVPTLNPGKDFSEWLRRIVPALHGARLLVVDSSSNDDTVPLAREAGAEVMIIKRQEFNHGSTRNWALHHLDDVDIVVFLTQDALITNDQSLIRLASAFADKEVGAVYGRQLPHDDATPLAAHLRQFNYPPRSHRATQKDAATLGIKAAFLSNSFAAYRRSALIEAGGFADDVILAEDMLAGAQLLQQNWQLAYCAEATVQHSHNYTLIEEFRRYFDIGVFHARKAWLLEWLGPAEGEGLRFVRSELRYLLRHAPHRLPEAGLRTLLKYAGYRLGRMEHLLPLRFKRQLSMHPRFWDS